MLLKEEMRRVMRYLDWRIDWWKSRSAYDEEREVDDDVADGLRAYALRQAEVHLSIMLAFRMKWDEKLVRSARDAAEVDLNLGETFIA